VSGRLGPREFSEEEALALPGICPLCSASNGQLHVESRVVPGGTDEHSYFRCGTCEVRFLWPRLSTEDEVRFYRDEFAVFMQSREGTESLPLTAQAHRERNEALRLERMARISADLSTPKRVLEVGCASGFMLLPLQAQGHSCMAVEPSGLFREDLNSRGLPTFESVDDLVASGDSSFDLIFHYFVLEHVGDPLGFIQQQIGLLAPGGTLEFELPCGNDALLEVYKLDSFRDFYFQVGHQWVFTPQSLSWLLDKTGMDVEVGLRQRYGLANHINWAENGRPGGNPVLAAIYGDALDSAYRERLVDTGHADTLTAVIRKL
jgi:SAM-dependent methyltransferase